MLTGLITELTSVCLTTATARPPLSNTSEAGFRHRCHQTERITDSLKQFGINKCPSKCFSDDFGGQMVESAVRTISLSEGRRPLMAKCCGGTGKKLRVMFNSWVDFATQKITGCFRRCGV